MNIQKIFLRLAVFWTIFATSSFLFYMLRSRRQRAQTGVFLHKSTTKTTTSHHIDEVAALTPTPASSNYQHQQQDDGNTINKTAKVLSVQWKRQQHLAEACQRMNLNHSSRNVKSLVGWNVLVNDEQKYIYCVIGKVASSTLKQVLLVGTGKIKESRPQDVKWGQDGRKTVRFLRRLASFSPRSIENRLRSYYKFMFVRHPLDRTLSAFRDKFRHQANYLSRYGTRIIRQFRGVNASAESLRRGHDVTLAEYVRFLLDPSMSRATHAERTDIHWIEQFKLCQPCSIGYDFIGHYETLDDDADYLVQRLQLDPKAQFPHQLDASGRPKKRPPVSNEDFQTAFAGVPSEDLEKLKELYAKDYELFGYS